MEGSLQVGRHQVGAGAILDFGREADEDDLEVAAVGRRVCQATLRAEYRPPESRCRREAADGVGRQTIDDGKADVQALIEAPAPTRSFTQRPKCDSNPGQALDLVLRHRPQVSRETGR